LTQDIKEEALEQLNLDMLFGFENEEALFEGIKEMFYDEADFDEDWLRQTISVKYKQHQKDSLTWARPNSETVYSYEVPFEVVPTGGFSNRFLPDLNMLPVLTH
jgi:hypothetical protein